MQGASQFLIEHPTSIQRVSNFNMFFFSTIDICILLTLRTLNIIIFTTVTYRRISVDNAGTYQIYFRSNYAVAIAGFLYLMFSLDFESMAKFKLFLYGGVQSLFILVLLCVRK